MAAESVKLASSLRKHHSLTKGMHSLLRYFVIIVLILVCGCSLVDTKQENKPAVMRPLPYPEIYVSYSDTNYINGYFFIAPFSSTTTGKKESSVLMILDGEGSVAWMKPVAAGSNFQLQKNGLMSYFAKSCFYLIDRNFRVVDSVSCVNDAATDAHEFKILDNGNYMLIGTKTVREDHSDFSIDTPIQWRGGRNMLVKYNVIQELDKNKNLIYEWSTQGHFNIADIDPVFLTDTGKIDIPHLNAFDIDSAGNFLLCPRYTNEVVYVDKKSGDVQWRFGGKRSDFIITEQPWPFIGQHDARFLPNGNIMLFDNGYSIPGNCHNAHSAEYKLNMQSKTAESVWNGGLPGVISESTGSTQRLPNGGTLISYGKILEGSQNVLFIVVDTSLHVRFHVEFTDTMGTYRTYYYPQMPFHLDRQKIIEEQQEDDENKFVILRTSTGDSCLWSTGEYSPSITVRKAGTYQYFVGHQDGSYTGSAPCTVGEYMVRSLRPASPGITTDH